MKKRILLVALMVALFVCLFVVSASAADLGYTPDTSRETVVLDDKQELAIWATDGSGLIWYIKGTDENGKNIYGYVSNLAQSTDLDVYVKYSNVWTNSTTTFQINQHGINIVEKNAGVTTNENGEEVPCDIVLPIDNIVVANLRYSDENPLILPGHKKPLNSLEKTFMGKNNLEYVFLPDNLVYLKAYTFQNCKKLKVCDLTNTKLISMQTNVFQNNPVLTTLGRIPDTFEEANGCFENMTALVSINLPSGTILGGQAFKGCSSLQTVEGLDAVLKNMADNGKNIPNDVFKGCKSLVADIVIYEGTAIIGSSAFYQCEKITSLTLPSTLTQINGSSNNNDDGAFEGCTSIKSITIPKSVTSIYGNAFTGCTGLTTLTFEDRLLPNGTYNSLTFHGWAPFEKCTSLTRVVLPEGLTNLPNGMFNACISLQSVTLASTITTIDGGSHFNGGYGAALREVIGLENTKITHIAHSMFRNAKLWTGDENGIVRLPNTVEYIGGYGLADVQMTTLYLGASFEYITEGNEHSFAGATKLKYVYAPATLTKISNGNANIQYIFLTSSDATTIESAKTASGFSNTVTYAEYNANPSGYTGKYIITGVNICDTFYNSIHVIDEENPLTNACAGVCEKCNEIQQAQNPEHEWHTTITYADLAKNGEKLVVCTHKNCAMAKAEPTSVEPIFVYLGFAAEKNSVSQFCVGYLINQAELEAYKQANQTEAISYGLVATAIANTNAPIGADGNRVNEKVVQANLSSVENAEEILSADFIIKGDFTKEANAYAELGMALYVTRTIGEVTEVSYVGNAGSTATIDAVTFADKFPALAPEKKEEIA